MAVNMSRSQRGSLLEGATDGKYRKVRPDTDPVPGNSAATAASRQHLHAEMNYGYINQELPAAQRITPGT
jgi:hypothetical protein